MSEWTGGKFGFFRTYRQFCIVVVVLLLCWECNPGYAETDTAKRSRTGGSSATTPEPPPAAPAGPTRIEPNPESISSQNSTGADVAKSPCDSNDDDAAPAMVVIRPGRFLMGSPDSETDRSSDEGPRHAVTIPKPFALSRCEITVGQFRRFIQDSGYKTTAETNGRGCFSWNVGKSDWEQKPGNYWDNPGFSQNDDHPVVCVSWLDAQRYIDWLSQRTGALYRLPTEAEWEYAARGGTDTSRFYGDKSQCVYANGLGQEGKAIAAKYWTLADCQDDYTYTAPVGRFRPNPFGLYDMLGNAWEWTLDCWHENYQNAPADGSAWLETDADTCDRRVVRGGSWDGYPQYLRSANRLRYGSVEADGGLGFRIARAL